jgi:hypothetical protein
VAWGHATSLRFPSPLIKPDVRISRIRLSDWFHLTAHGGDTELVRAVEAAGDGKRAQQHQISGRLRRRVKPLQKRPDAQGCSRLPPITDPRLRPKRTRSKGPFLRQHYPASTVVWPSPTPVRPAAFATLGLPAPVETGLPRLRASPFQRAVPTIPADRDGCLCRLLPRSRGLPRFPGGSASATSLSRPAQTSLALRPAGLLSRPRRPLSRGSGPVSYPTKPLVSYRSNRQLSGWNPPPLVLRAVGAHWEIGVRGAKRRARATLQGRTPLACP